MQTVSTVGAFGLDRIQSLQHGIQAGTGFDL